MLYGRNLSRERFNLRGGTAEFAWKDHLSNLWVIKNLIEKVQHRLFVPSALLRPKHILACISFGKFLRESFSKLLIFDFWLARPNRRASSRVEFANYTTAG